MKITIITVGKIKEKFYREALAEYTKRLSRYCKLEILEVADEKTPENASRREEELLLQKEGERILRYIKPEMTVFALAIEGESLNSTDFAQVIERQGLQGHSSLAFLIGGSLGLHPDVLKQCHRKISFSPMTFPHHLARIMVLEQLYRAESIQAGSKYHK